MPTATLQTDLVETYRTQLEDRPVLLYDGVCVVCNRTVQFLLRRDRRSVLRFIPIDSPLGQQLLALYHVRQDADPSREGVVLITHALTPATHIFRRTDAFVTVLQLLTTPWPVIGTLLRLIPRFLREPAYTLFARYRYRIFGRHATCPIPTPEQRSRILGIPETL